MPFALSVHDPQIKCPHCGGHDIDIYIGNDWEREGIGVLWSLVCHSCGQETNNLHIKLNITLVEEEDRE